MACPQRPQNRSPAFERSSAVTAETVGTHHGRHGAVAAVATPGNGDGGFDRVIITANQRPIGRTAHSDDLGLHLCVHLRRRQSLFNLVDRTQHHGGLLLQAGLVLVIVLLRELTCLQVKPGIAHGSIQEIPLVV